jgi:hypothetical protein
VDEADHRGVAIAVARGVEKSSARDLSGSSTGLPHEFSGPSVP